jgi:hypothetical protein
MSRLLDKFPWLNQEKDRSDVELADLLLQPVEHSYTVESLGYLLNNAGLEYWLPCLNQFDKTLDRLTWNIDFEDEVVARHYNELPDIERWQITNLFSIDNSPMLGSTCREETPATRESRSMKSFGISLKLNSKDM